MKKNHSMNIGDTKEFNNLQEVQDFAEEFNYTKEEFKFLEGESLIMEKVN
jgi:predicted DNA binding CopG/RHH family protein